MKGIVFKRSLPKELHSGVSFVLSPHLDDEILDFNLMLSGA